MPLGTRRTAWRAFHREYSPANMKSACTSYDRVGPLRLEFSQVRGHIGSVRRAERKYELGLVCTAAVVEIVRGGSFSCLTVLVSCVTRRSVLDHDDAVPKRLVGGPVPRMFSTCGVALPVRVLFVLFIPF